MADPTARLSFYRLLGRIGRGAMGEVYRAVDERLGREVAVKILPEAVAASADRQERFMREARAAGGLNHPGIVTVHDIGNFKGRLFIVMELVDGVRLSDLAHGRGGGPPPTAREALRLCADAADALGTAHARGILHRDVKSDNLMRTRDGRVKVLDFGLAKLTVPDLPFPEASPDSAAHHSLETFVSAATAVPRPLDTDPVADTVAHGAGAPASAPAPGTGDAAGAVASPGLDDTAVPGVFYDPFAPAAGAAASGPASSPPHVAALRSAPEALSGSGTQPSQASNLTVAGQLMGTPAYMAPEQARGEHPTARSEVFSLGVVLYELLTGMRPFDRATVPQTLEAVRAAVCDPPSRAAPERRLSVALDALVMRALAPDPEARFHDMEAFAAAARAAMAGLNRPPRGRRYAALGGAAAALLGGALLVAKLAGGPSGAGGTGDATGAPPGGAPLVSGTVANAGIPAIAAPAASVSATRRITFEAGCEEQPTFTPDARTVVYDGLVGSDYEMLALDLDSGARRALTSEPGWDYCGAVSPDGKRVAYLHLKDSGDELRIMELIVAPGPTASAASAAATSAPASASASASAPRSVRPASAASMSTAGASGASGSAAGTGTGTGTGAGTGTGTRTGTGTGTGTGAGTGTGTGTGAASEKLGSMTLGGPYASCPVWTDDGALLIGADTGEIRRWELTEEGPRPSPLLTLPTGLSPAYLATLRDGTLFVVWQHASDWNWFGLGAVAPDHAVRTVEERLSPLAQFIARDGAGAGVYYVRPAPTGRELVWRPPAGEARLAANGVLASSGLAVSPDRTRMVYSTCLEYQYLVRLRPGAAPADITSRSEWRDRAPIRADARRFVYTSDRSGHDQLLVYDLASGASAVLAERSSRRGAVSPDGKLVAFHDDAAGGLFVAPLAGGGATPRRLTTDATDADPQFSHDAAYVFFVRATPGGSRLFAVPAAGGDAVQITTTDATSPAASPVADLVVYISSTPRGETVMATDAAGSFHRPFRADLGPAVYRSPRFSPDGKRLLLSRKHTEVVEVPVSGGKPEVRWRATVEGIDALDYAPDGDGYVASIILWDGDLWLADGVFP